MFEKATHWYGLLRQKYEAGEIGGEKFAALVNRMVVRDEQGRIWKIGVKTGKWYRREGRKWVEDTPPAGKPKPAAKPAAAAKLPAKTAAPAPVAAPARKRSPWMTCSLLGMAGIALLCTGGVIIAIIAAMVGGNVSAAASPSQVSGASPTRASGSTPGGAQPANTPAAPRATEPSASQMLAGLQVSDVLVVEEQPGYGYVVGLVTNRNAHPVSSVSVNVDVYGSGGATLDSGSTHALIYVLDPGQSAPFMYSYFVSSGTPAARAEATLAEVEFSDRPAYAHSLEITDQRSFVTSYGYVFITGTLANRGAVPVSPNPLAVLSGPSGQLIGAGGGFGYLRVLTPGQETPFQIQLGPLSPGLLAIVEQSSYEIILDGWQAEAPVAQPINILQDHTFYVDAFGGAHLVGMLENNGAGPMSVYLQAALYDADQHVLDATNLSVAPFAIPPGASVPYDLNYWGVVGYNPQAQALISQYGVMVDPGYTYPSELTAFSAAVEDGNWTYADNGVTFTGRVVNSSSAAADLTVLGVVSDSSGVPLAVASTQISGAAPGQSSFECNVTMPAGFDPATAKFTLLAFGNSR